MDSGAPKSVAGMEWYSEYIKENNIKESEVKQRKVKETFKFGAGGLFESKIHAEVHFKVKDKEGTISEVKMKICLVDHDNIEKLGVITDFSQKTVVFKNIDSKM